MTVKDTVLCLSELGWLYSKVSTYITSCEKATVSRGLAVQAFTYALQEELHDYYRLLAVLEQELARKIANNENNKSGILDKTDDTYSNGGGNNSNGNRNSNGSKNHHNDNYGNNGHAPIVESRRFNAPSQNINRNGNQTQGQGQGQGLNNSQSHENETNSTTWVSSVDANATSGLTLLRLKAWMQDPLDRMCIMARLVDSAAPLTGGIANHLQSFYPRYDFLLDNCVCPTVRPLFSSTTSYYAVSHCTTPCHNTQCCTILYNGILHCIIPHHATLNYTMLCYTIQYYAILHSTVSYRAILY